MGEYVDKWFRIVFVDYDRRRMIDTQLKHYWYNAYYLSIGLERSRWWN